MRGGEWEWGEGQEEAGSWKMEDGRVLTDVSGTPQREEFAADGGKERKKGLRCDQEEADGVGWDEVGCHGMAWHEMRWVRGEEEELEWLGINEDLETNDQGERLCNALRLQRWEREDESREEVDPN